MKHIVSTGAGLVPSSQCFPSEIASEIPGQPNPNL